VPLSAKSPTCTAVSSTTGAEFFTLALPMVDILARRQQGKQIAAE